MVFPWIICYALYYQLYLSTISNYTLYSIEFFFRLKSNVFIQSNVNDLILLFKDEIEFGYFLNQAKNLFSIVLDTILHHIFEEKSVKELSKEQVKLFEKLSRNVSNLTELTRHHLQELNLKSKSVQKEERLIKAIHFVSKLYFASITFLRDFFQLQKFQGVI